MPKHTLSVIQLHDTTLHLVSYNYTIPSTEYAHTDHTPYARQHDLDCAPAHNDQEYSSILPQCRGFLATHTEDLTFVNELQQCRLETRAMWC